MRKAVRLDTREARSKLAGEALHWREVTRGKALGYRRGTRKPEWYLREYLSDRYVKRAIGQADDVLPADGVSVLSWEQALKRALGESVESMPSSRGARLVREIADLYFEARRSKSRSALSVTTDEGKIRAAVLPTFGDWVAADVTSADLRRWRDKLVADAMLGSEKLDDATRREKQRRAQATANRIWAIFRAVLNFGHADGHIATDAAWRGVKSFRKVDRPRERFLSVVECRRLLNACAPDFRAIVRGALLTGLRYSELCRLKVADHGNKAIVVHAGKSDVARRVPLTSEGAEFFDELVAGRPGDAAMFLKADGTAWVNQDQKRRMATACAAAKLKPRATFHDLRRSYGSLLVNAGAPMAAIATALGHSDQRMTQRVYARLQDSVLRKELQKRLPRFERKRSAKVRSIDSAKSPRR